MNKNQFVATVTKDTTMYTGTAQSAGRTLVESFTGNDSLENYRDLSAETLIDGILQTAADYYTDGALWLSEEDAENSDYEMPRGYTLEAFTADSLAYEILKAANNVSILTQPDGRVQPLPPFFG